RSDSHCHSATPLRAPNSFPTRRSSDLRAGGAHEGNLLAGLGVQADVLQDGAAFLVAKGDVVEPHVPPQGHQGAVRLLPGPAAGLDRKSTRLNSSHVSISYAVFCL